MRQIVRSLIEIVDDPHEFATAYARHVDEQRAKGAEPLSVTAAVQAFIRKGDL